MPSFIALLRAVNVGGTNKIPMAALRSVCEGLGWANVRTYIQSGNVVFDADGSSSELEVTLERALQEAFGASVPVLVRSARDWAGIVRDHAFPDASEREPNRVMLALSKSAPADAAVEGLRARATEGERVERAGDALWIHYPSGSGRSKLSPGVLDRLVGSPVTTRNLRTVLKLLEMANEPSGA